MINTQLFTLMKLTILKSIIKRFLTRGTAVCLTFIAVAFTSVGALEIPTFQVPFPEGYQRWTHIESSITGFNKVPQGKSDGFQHIYANDRAMEGYKSGIFPDGSILVFDKQEADTSGNYIRPGKRKFIDVMYKDGALFKETGGWGFEEFSGNSKTEGRISGLRQLNCFKSCHQNKAKTDFVFTRFKE
jgi:hypothetical protein